MTEIQDDHHVAHYCQTYKLDGDLLAPEAFKPRPQDDYVSADWVEYHGSPDVESNLGGVRKALGRSLGLTASARIAVLRVGEARRVGSRLISSFWIDPKPELGDPSHAGIGGYSIADRFVYEALSALVGPDDIYEAKVSSFTG